MARGEARRRRKRRRSNDSAEDELEAPGYRVRGRRQRDRRRHSRDGERARPSRQTTAEERWSRPSPHERPVTCLQCANLLITRSIVKLIGESWDRATAYPTYSCFEQRWTLENPAAADDPAAVTPYLVGEADRCPTYRGGHARDFRPDHGW